MGDEQEQQEDVVVSCPDCGAEPGQHTERCHLGHEQPSPLRPQWSGRWPAAGARASVGDLADVGTSCPDCGKQWGPGDGHTSDCPRIAYQARAPLRDKGRPHIEGCICGLDERDRKARHSDECWQAAVRRVEKGERFHPSFIPVEPVELSPDNRCPGCGARAHGSVTGHTPGCPELEKPEERRWPVKVYQPLPDRDRLILESLKREADAKDQQKIAKGVPCPECHSRPGHYHTFKCSRFCENTDSGVIYGVSRSVPEARTGFPPVPKERWHRCPACHREDAHREDCPLRDGVRLREKREPCPECKNPEGKGWVRCGICGGSHEATACPEANPRSWSTCPCGQPSRPGGDTRTNVYRGDELVEVRYPHADGVQCCWTREKRR